MKITAEQYEEFRKDFVFQKLRNGTYRYGQHFLNSFPEVKKCMAEDGDHGYADMMVVWQLDDPVEFERIMDWYLPVDHNNKNTV